MSNLWPSSLLFLATLEIAIFKPPLFDDVYKGDGEMRDMMQRGGRALSPPSLWYLYLVQLSVITPHPPSRTSSTSLPPHHVTLQASDSSREHLMRVERRFRPEPPLILLVLLQPRWYY